MPEYTATAHTRITVTADTPEAAQQAVRDLTDQAAEHLEATAPAADVTVARSAITGLGARTAAALETARQDACTPDTFAVLHAFATTLAARLGLPGTERQLAHITDALRGAYVHGHTDGAP